MRIPILSKVLIVSNSLASVGSFIFPTRGLSLAFQDRNTVSERMTTSAHFSTGSSSSSKESDPPLPRDPVYPGTSNTRLNNVHKRVAQLTVDDLKADWEEVRRKLLWAGGLRDLPNAVPGMGYTGHAFNDYNHVDLTPMLDKVSDNQNDGSIVEIARGNMLGPGIRIASDPSLGPGGSWSTCANGCHMNPPQDVAHIQFQSRIAFKLVWVPSSYTTFVLVDDDGNLLTKGTPGGELPPLRERQMNYRLVAGSKYARAADSIADLQ
jgi:hypothetical protein